MAIIKAINSKSSVSHIVNYVANKDKTNEELMYGKDCSSNPDQAIEDMKTTKELYKKTDGRKYKHFVQSFDPKDKLTPSKALEIGKEWAEKVFKGFEVFIATHTDKDHLHNHFVVNTVNFETGEKYRQSRADLEKYKELSNKICEREGLTPTEPNKNTLTSFNQKKYKALEKGYKTDYKSYMLELWRNVNSSKKKAISKEQFIKSMEDKGYKVNWKDTRKYVTFETLEGKKVRDTRLAETFKNEQLTKEGLLNEFERNREVIRTREDVERIHGKIQADSREAREEDIRAREEDTDIRRRTDTKRELDQGARGTDVKEQTKKLSEINKDDEFMKQYLEERRRKSLAQKRARARGNQKRRRNDLER